MFDRRSFGKTKYTARTIDVPLPGLAAYFGADELPLFTVRGLTGPELFKVREAPERAEKMAAMIDAVAGRAAALAREFKNLLGLAPECDDTSDYLQRLDLLELCLIEPPLDRPEIVKLAENHPAEFKELSDVIWQLTGAGSQPGK